MTDQSTEQNKNIFEGSKQEPVKKAEDQSASSDQGQKTTDPFDFNQLLKDQLGTIVDDNGEQKYKDPLTALEALKNAQSHIKTIERENSELRQNSTGKDTLEQVLNKLSASKEPEKTKSEGIDAEQLKGMVLEAIKEDKSISTKEANKQLVSDKLVEVYGDTDKAKKAYQDKATELGMDINDLVTLAEKSPRAALAYFDTSSKSSPSFNSGSINTDNFQSSQGKKEAPKADRLLKSQSSPAIQKWLEAGEGLEK